MPRTIIAEFHMLASRRLELFSLTTIEHGDEYDSRTLYDVNWSKRVGAYLFHQTGAGGSGPVRVSGIYFASVDAEINEAPSTLVDAKARERNRTRRLRRLPKAFDAGRGHDLLDWLQDNAIQQDAVYCSVCQDDLPEDDPCEHCWWCDKTATWSTPGARCGCADRDECYDDG